MAVYNSTDDLVIDLQKYFKDPKGTEEAFSAASLVYDSRIVDREIADRGVMQGLHTRFNSSSSPLSEAAQVSEGRLR
jgi:hypothetical protein